MVIYLDMAFLLNCLSDGAALYVTAQVSGLPIRRRRLLLASAAGGTYGALCAIPSARFAASFLPQLAAAALLVRMAFGRQKAFFRQFLLFFMLSCTMGGVLLAMGRLLRENGGLELLRTLNWNVFFLAGGVCFLALTVIFRGGARHALAGQLCQGSIELRGKRTPVTVLLDTGHTLTDGGQPVLTVYYAALDPLWTPWERTVLSRLEADGPARCLERLGDAGFRLLPYQTVGVSGGLLLCFRAEQVELDGQTMGALTVALSPTEVSDGGGYHGLWGGERKEGNAA